MATKKTTAPVKEDTKVATAAVKEEVKTESKPAAKAPAKKAPAKKAVETKVSVTLQYTEKNTTVDSIVEAAKAAYKAEGNTDEIKTLDIYLQPENGVAYYVVNGNSEGKSVKL